MFYVWIDPGINNWEPLASFRTQMEAEAAGVGYVCSQSKSGTWEALVTDSTTIDAITVRSFIRASAGYVHTGQPGNWHGNNGEFCGGFCAEPVTADAFETTPTPDTAADR